MINSYEMEEKKLLNRIRLLTVFYIVALLFWGITAFPLESELAIICNIMGISEDAAPDTYSGLKYWIATVYEGLISTNRDFPFLAYGTDWLAFSHIVIAVAFIGLYFKPIRNIWIVYFGIIACIGVIPLALICGEIRGIPFYWRMIDCSFCLFGIIPLYVLRVYIKRLDKITGYIPHKY